MAVGFKVGFLWYQIGSGTVSFTGKQIFEC